MLTWGVDRYRYAYQLDRKKDYYSRENMVRAGEQAVIYHYSGNLFGRPWVTGNESALTELWNRYLDMTSWKGMVQWKVKISWLDGLGRMVARLFPGPAAYRFLLPIYFQMVLPQRYWKRRGTKRDG